MTRRYLWVLLAALAGGVFVSVLLRVPRAVTTMTAAPAEISAVELVLTVHDGRIEPAAESIAAGTTVDLTVTNRAATSQYLRLAGYEDRVDTGEIKPGATWAGTFIADRPGDQFAWLVNGQPAGRLDIRGSHLVEGHR